MELIKYHNESIAFSLITIDLSVNPAIKINQDSRWKTSEVASESYKQRVNYFRDFTYSLIEFAVYLLPMLFLWGLIIFLVYWIAGKLYSRFK